MPGIVVFRRRWSVGSDDLVVPGVFLFILHTIWLIVLAAIYGVVGSRTASNAEECWSELREHIVGYLVILSGCVIIEFCIANVAMRGTILDPTPRASMQYLLYVRLAVLVAELVWLILGVVWLSRHYTTCTSQAAKDAILGIVVCNWCVMVSVMITIWCTFDAAGRSWVKMKRYQRSMRDTPSKFQYRRSGNRNRNWRHRKVLRAYQDSWDHRCRVLFCCMGQSDDARNSFSDIARLLSEFFRDLDVVPSDVVAGLVLLRKYQKLNRQDIVKSNKNDVYEFLSGVPITPSTRFLQLSSTEGKEEFEKIVHYMRFALAIYGWPMFVVTSSTGQVCKLCPMLRCFQCCCRPSSTDTQVVDDNCCACNVAALRRMIPMDDVDLVYATFHVDVGETPFFVALDHKRKTVVISIRGTLSMKDVVTDLNAESEPLPMDETREDWLGHKGMVSAAEYIRRKLREDNILSRALSYDASQGTEAYDLVLVGHSLGAGTAAILAILMKQQHPNLTCFAYSPPGGLLSLPVVEYTKDFITSVVVGKDVVPRIGLHQMETMRADLINAIQRSKDPKWKTIGASVRCCGGWEDSGGEAEEFSTTRAAMRDHASHPSDSSIALTVHQPLYPPGRILHVVRNHPQKRHHWIGRSSPVYQAVWRDNDEFDEVLVSPCMIQDHMPDKVLKALEKVLENPGPRKPGRVTSTNRKRSATSNDGETLSLLTPSCFRSSPTTPSPTLRTPVTTTPLKISTPPHKLLLETSFTSSPVTSPDPTFDLRTHARLHSPAITWELLSALEEQLLSGMREAARGIEREDWTIGFAPLASPETLSEASSIVSRASLLRRSGRFGYGNEKSHNSPLVNRRLPTAKLGMGYCFYVDAQMMDSKRGELGERIASERLPESSDEEELTPRPISPVSYITLDPIVITPQRSPQRANETSGELTGDLTDHSNTHTPVQDTDNDTNDTNDPPSSSSSSSSHRFKAAHMSRDSGYGERLNGLSAASGEWGASVIGAVLAASGLTDRKHSGNEGEGLTERKCSGTEESDSKDRKHNYSYSSPLPISPPPQSPMKEDEKVQENYDMDREFDTKGRRQRHDYSYSSPLPISPLSTMKENEKTKENHETRKEFEDEIERKECQSYSHSAPLPASLPTQSKIEMGTERKNLFEVSVDAKQHLNYHPDSSPIHTHHTPTCSTISKSAKGLDRQHETETEMGEETHQTPHSHTLHSTDSPTNTHNHPTTSSPPPHSPTPTSPTVGEGKMGSHPSPRNSLYSATPLLHDITSKSQESIGVGMGTRVASRRAESSV